MSHPGHIRHFYPNSINNNTQETKDLTVDKSDSPTIRQKKSNHSFALFNKLKSNLLTESRKTYKEEKNFVKEKRNIAKNEMKQKYLTTIKEQKSKGVLEWLMIPVTWLEWKLINKPMIIQRLVGLLILVMSVYALYILSNFLDHRPKTLVGMIEIVIGMILYMILPFIAIIGLGLTFMKHK